MNPADLRFFHSHLKLRQWFYFDVKPKLYLRIFEHELTNDSLDFLYATFLFHCVNTYAD